MCVRKETLVFCVASTNRKLKDGVEYREGTCDMDFFQEYPSGQMGKINCGVFGVFPFKFLALILSLCAPSPTIII